jgi:hypothetical protein
LSSIEVDDDPFNTIKGNILNVTNTYDISMKKDDIFKENIILRRTLMDTNKKYITDITSFLQTYGSLTSAKYNNIVKFFKHINTTIDTTNNDMYINLTTDLKNNINNIYTQMASLNPFTPTKVIETTNKIEEEVVIITPKIIDEEVAPVIISQKTYYIIAGAFAEQKNANKMLAKLNKWNYNATIVEGGNFLRVSYDTFNNKDKAIIALNKIKQENPEAWLLAK